MGKKTHRPQNQNLEMRLVVVGLVVVVVVADLVVVVVVEWVVGLVGFHLQQQVVAAADQGFLPNHQAGRSFNMVFNIFQNVPK